jgi:PIN domain nuclease of toxin-antitoxin system
VIALDTHALIWWLSDPTRLPAKVRRLLDAAIVSPEPVAVSSISAWEIAMLVDRGRLKLTMPTNAWIAHVEALPFVRFVPADNALAVNAVALRDFPSRDPADRIIVATAIGLGASLLTADERIRKYRAVKTVWD